MLNSDLVKIVTKIGKNKYQINALNELQNIHLKKEMIEVVCDVAVETLEPKVRFEAIELLKRNDREIAADKFSRYATEGDHRQRKWALINLSLINCRTKMEVVIRGLRDPDISVQQAAAMNIGLYYDSKFLKAVESYFEKNKYTFLKESILHLFEISRKLL